MIGVYLAITDEDRDAGTVTALISSIPIDKLDHFIDGLRDKFTSPG